MSDEWESSEQKTTQPPSPNLKVLLATHLCGNRDCKYSVLLYHTLFCLKRSFLWFMLWNSESGRWTLLGWKASTQFSCWVLYWNTISICWNSIWNNGCLILVLTSCLHRSVYNTLPSTLKVNEKQNPGAHVWPFFSLWVVTDSAILTWS